MVSQPTPASQPAPVPQPPTSYVTKLLQTFEGHEQCISAVAALPDARRIVTSSKDKTLCLWELSTKKALKRLVGHSSDVLELAVSRDGKLIASCDATGGIIPWDGETGNCLINDRSGSGFAKTQAGTQHGSNTTIVQSVASQFIAAHQSTAVLSLDFSIDGKFLASAGNRTVKFLGTTTWQEENAITLDAVVFCIRYSPSGEHLAIAMEKDIGIYNAGTMDCIRLLKGHLGGTFALTWTLKGTYLVSGGGRRDATLRVWDASEWTEICEAFHGHTDQINSISVNESSTIITSASADSSVRLWSFPIQSNILKVSASASCVTFSKDCRYIFSGGDDLKISQWELPSTGLVMASTQAWTKTTTEVVETKVEIFTMSETAQAACITGDFSTAVEIFTQEIKENSSNHVCYGHRAIALAREHNWDAALEDANQSISIKRSSVGFMSKGIALCGKGQIREACSAFDLALKMATGDSTTHNLISLMKAVAIFYANEHEEAIMCVKDMAEFSVDSDLLTCNVVLTYLYTQMGFTALENNTLEKALEYITAAMEIATTHSFHNMEFSKYTEFIVTFGWDLQSLWKNLNMYHCLALFRACRIEALECYRSLVDACNETERESLITWFASHSGGGISFVPMRQSARGTSARENAEDETQKATDLEWSANGYQSQTYTSTKTETVKGSKSDDSKHAITTGGPDIVYRGRPWSNQLTTAGSGTEVTEVNVERETKVGIVADEKIQEKIKKALDSLPNERKCDQGYAWVQISSGFQCDGGGHRISWEELDNVDVSVN